MTINQITQMILISLITLLPAMSFAEDILVQATFTKVDEIRMGSLANYTSTDQPIAIRFKPSKLVNVGTQENLLSSPDAYFAFSSASMSASTVGSAPRCLELVQSLNGSSRFTVKGLHLWVQATKVSGTNFVVNKIDSCSLLQ